MGILLDLGFVAVIVLCMIWGYKKGFFKTIIGLVGIIIALVLAGIFSGLLAHLLYDTIFRNMLANNINHVITTSTAPASDQAAQILQGLPNVLNHSIASAGITPDQVQQSISSGSSNVAYATADVISPAIISFLQLIIAIVLVIAFYIGIRILAKLLNNAFKIPVLKQINGLLGAGVGVIKGMIFVFLICIVLQVFVNILGEHSFLQTMTQQSFVFKFIFTNNPLLTWF